MRTLLFALLVGGTRALLVTLSQFNVSTPFEDIVDPLKVVFFDFDRTLTVGSTSAFLGICDANCATYTPNGSCPCNQTATAFGDFLVANLSSRVLGEPDDIGFNGTDRRDRLVQTLTFLNSRNITTLILSTASYYQSAENWAYFIHKFLDLANLSTFFPVENIFTLADPGQNISANKGIIIQTFLMRRNLTMHNGLLVDDSPENIESAQGKIDWLHVNPRSGITLDQIRYIETRAARPLYCSPFMPRNGQLGTCNASRVGGGNCSIVCNSGYVVDGPPSQQCVVNGREASLENTQSCVAATCPSPLVANGRSGTCTNITTGQNCSIICASGFVVYGPVEQMCVANGSGAVLQNTQSCGARPQACPTADLALFLSQCTDKDISSSCQVPCGTAASWLSKSFVKLASTPQFIETCIRNSMANMTANATSVSSATVDSVVSRAQAGTAICRSVSSDAFRSSVLVAAIVSFLCFLI